MRSFVIRGVLIAAAHIALPAVGVAQAASESPWYDRARTWSLFEENDAFGHSDSSYTQGLRLTFNYSFWNPAWNLPFAILSGAIVANPFFDGATSIRNECTPLSPRDGRPCGTFGFGLGQTIYTPSDLRTAIRQLNQRPYAGYLFTSFGSTVLYPAVQVSTELVVGTTGPPAIARETQSMAHWTFAWDSPQPQGWQNQIKAAPQLALINQYAGHLLEFCRIPSCNGSYEENRWFDLSPEAEIDLGLPMTRASAGATARLGWHVPDVMTIQRIPTTRARTQVRGESTSGFGSWIRDAAPWAMLFATWDGRDIGVNELLTGTSADHGADGWATVREISAEHYVRESSWGWAVGSNYWTVVFQHVTRSAEYRPNGGKHRFGSITFSVHSPNAPAPAPATK